MATGYKLPDGRDLSDIFGTGSYGSAVGYSTSDGKDVGYQFAGGSTGIVTGYRDQAGVDLGSRFGPPGHCTITCGEQSGKIGWLSGTFGSISRKPLMAGAPLAGVYLPSYGATCIAFESNVGQYRIAVNGVTFQLEKALS